MEIWLDDEATPVDVDSYERVTCPSCARIHFINRTTGKALGDKGN